MTRTLAKIVYDVAINTVALFIVVGVLKFAMN